MNTTRDIKTADEITAQYRISDMTLWRWQRRPVNPFPAPFIGSNKSKRLWKTADIEAWERRESELILNQLKATSLKTAC